ncbi:protein PIF-like [Saccostrea echinata]|uniref:protein PIF-like n=1 Tax=Saccostrea echinata TaxID=191078 RepID=UPI002A831300|nr:protein PIF-like [Saccostrea echinata]
MFRTTVWIFILFHLTDTILANNDVIGTDCIKPFDIYFAIDGSDSISYKDYQLLKKSIFDLVDQLNIGEGNGRMGMLVYSSSLATMVEPSFDRDYLKEHAMNLPHPQEGTNTALGIRTMTEIFQVANRTGVPQIGVVITDGRSKTPEEAAREARIAKDIGINMYSVGVTENIDIDELKSIASSKANVLSVQSFGQLASRIQDVVQLVCPTTTTTTTTTPAPTTTTIPTTTPEGATPPMPPTMAPTKGPCDDCKMLNGIGFNPHPDNCDKFTQCYFGPNGQVRMAYRQCPFGQYWDQSVLTCRPSEQVPCQKDKCGKPRITSYAYSNTGNCRAHWACNFGKATATCCLEGFRYVPYVGCKKDPKCTDPCPPTFQQEGPCDTRMIFNEPRYFEQFVNGLGWLKMPCAPGTQYDPNTCQCSLHASFLPGKECKAELFIPFSNDAKDYSGKNVYVENQGVRILGNGLGYFNGSARLIINRFANIDFYSDLVVKMRYLDDPRSSGLHALFSNGDCCDNPATMLLLKSRDNLHFMAKTEVKMKNETIDRVTTFHLPAKRGNWNEVYYMHDTKSLEGKVNGIGMETWAYGPIKRSRAALHIGYGRGLQNFRGYMDYVTVFLCRPRYLSTLCSGDKDCQSFLFNGETKQVQLLSTIESPGSPSGWNVNWRYFARKIEPRVCDAGWEKFGQSCYLFSLSYGSWNNGKAFCEGQGGYLVELTSLEEDTFVRDYVRNRGLTAFETRDSWIGGTDVASEGSFVWSESGQPITYNNWGPNNPDNGGGNQHCLILFQPSDYKWHDTQCTNTNSYICEN